MGDKKDKKKKSSLPTQMNLVIRIVAGGYLCYLAYNIYGTSGEVQGAEKIIFPVVTVLFAVIGAVIIVSALRAMQRGEYVGGARDTGGKNGEEKAVKEEAKAEPDRIRFGEPETLPREMRKETAGSEEEKEERK